MIITCRAGTELETVYLWLATEPAGEPHLLLGTGITVCTSTRDCFYLFWVELWSCPTELFPQLPFFYILLYSHGFMFHKTLKADHSLQ